MKKTTVKKATLKKPAVKKVTAKKEKTTTPKKATSKAKLTLNSEVNSKGTSCKRRIAEEEPADGEDLADTEEADEAGIDEEADEIERLS